MHDDQNNLTPNTGELPNTPTDQAGANQHAANVVRGQIDELYEQAATDPNNPYNKTHEESFDWRTYHSAWQDYYKEYYRRYYHALTGPKSETDQSQTTVGSNETTAEVKKDILQQVKHQAKRFKQSNHFLPVISALSVGTVFIFLQFNSILIAQVKAYVSPGALEGQNLVITDPVTNIAVGPEPRLIIPKINVDIPVDYTVNATDDPTVQVALRNAAVHYKLPGADSLPGQFGNTSILGHSSNDVFAAGNQKFALVLADHLEPGDTFYLHYNSVRYTYKVTEKKIINPDQVGTLQLGYEKPMATLITCTPPGTALKRLLVFGEQINPDPLVASKPADTTQTTEQTIPGNSPTLLQQIWDFFF